MESLPDNALFQIFLGQTLNQLQLACKADRIINQRVCQNDNFWQQKYQIDFNDGLTPQDLPGILTWKQLYQHKYYKENGLVKGVLWSIGEDQVSAVYFDSDAETSENPEDINLVLSREIPLTVDDQGMVNLEIYGMTKQYFPGQLPDLLHLMGAIKTFFDQPITIEFAELLGVSEEEFPAELESLKKEFGPNPTLKDMLAGQDKTFLDYVAIAVDRTGREKFGHYEVSFS